MQLQITNLAGVDVNVWRNLNKTALVTGCYKVFIVFYMVQLYTMICMYIYHLSPVKKL